LEACGDGVLQFDQFVFGGFQCGDDVGDPPGKQEEKCEREKSAHASGERVPVGEGASAQEFREADGGCGEECGDGWEGEGIEMDGASGISGEECGDGAGGSAEGAGEACHALEAARDGGEGEGCFFEEGKCREERQHSDDSETEPAFVR